MRRRKWVLLSRGVSSTPSPRSDADGDFGFGVRVWGHGTKGQLGIPKEKASEAMAVLLCVWLVAARFVCGARVDFRGEILRGRPDTHKKKEGPAKPLEAIGS